MAFGRGAFNVRPRYQGRYLELGRNKAYCNIFVGKFSSILMFPHKKSPLMYVLAFKIFRSWPLSFYKVFQLPM